MTCPQRIAEKDGRVYKSRPLRGRGPAVSEHSETNDRGERGGLMIWGNGYFLNKQRAESIS